MRYVILLASVLIQVCIGGLYAWSSFVPALRSSYGLSTAQTQVVFGGLIAVFSVATVPAGRLLNRWGPKRVAGIGSVLFGAGYLTASLSDGTFPVLLLGISLLAGMGTGFCYVCPLALCAKWFPSRKGLVTGVAVAGFGGGAVLLSSLAEFLFSRGLDVLTILRWVGICYAAVMLGASMVLKAPSSHHGMHQRSAPALRVLVRDSFFCALFLGMFSSTFAGLLVIGNLKPLALAGGISPALAAVAISAFAMGNAGGRIIWGWVADRLGARSIPLALIFMAAALGTLLVVAASPTSFVVASMLIGFGFGSSFVVYAAQVGSQYGPDRVGSVYPLVFLAYGVSGIAGPWVGGWLYDVTASYVPGIAVSLAFVVVGLLASSWLLRKARAIGCVMAEKVPATSSR